MRIMIVDDSSFMRALIRRTVVEGGWDVVGESADGSEVLQTYGRCSPDVVTMDVTMAQVSGVEAVRRLLVAFPEARVVMVSALGQQEIILDALRSGALGYVVKPFEGDALRREISRVHGGRRIAQEL